MVSVLMVMNSCEKKEEGAKVSEQIAEEDAALEDLLTVVEEQVDAYTYVDYDGNAKSSELKASSNTVTYPLVTISSPNPQSFWPKVMTIDYGPENIEVVIQPGIVPVKVLMKGKVIFTQTGLLFESHSTRNVAFNGYHINNNKIEGSKIFTNMGYSNAENPLFGWVVNIKLTTPDGFWVTREAEKLSEMTAGSTTLRNIWDDEFKISGSVNGENSKGWEYSHTVVENKPIYRKRVCRFPVAGAIEIDNSLKKFTLDYGNGECDNLATLTDQEGKVVNIFLGRKWQAKK